MATVGQGDDGTWSADAAADEIRPDTAGSPSVTTSAGAHRAATESEAPPVAPISLFGRPTPPPPSEHEAVLPPLLPRPRRAPDATPPAGAAPVMTEPMAPITAVPAGPAPRPDLPVPPGPGLGGQASAGMPLDPGRRQPSSGDVVDAEIVGPQPRPARRASKFEQQDTDEWILPTEPEVDPPPPTLEEITALFPTVRSGPATLPSDTWSGAPTRQFRHLQRRGSLVGWVVGIVALLVVSGAGVALYLDWGGGEQRGASAPLPLGTSDSVTVVPTTLTQLDPAMSAPAASDTSPRPTATTSKAGVPSPTTPWTLALPKTLDASSGSNRECGQTVADLGRVTLGFGTDTVLHPGKYVVTVYYYSGWKPPSITVEIGQNPAVQVGNLQSGCASPNATRAASVTITTTADAGSITFSEQGRGTIALDKVLISRP
jgi:hypothetical protein